jgi:hypothetical protein
MKHEPSRNILGKYSNIKFHKNMFIGSRVFRCRRTDMTKLIVAFRNLGSAPIYSKLPYKLLSSHNGADDDSTRQRFLKALSVLRSPSIPRSLLCPSPGQIAHHTSIASPWAWRQLALPKVGQLFTGRHGLSSQKTGIGNSCLFGWLNLKIFSKHKII